MKSPISLITSCIDTLVSFGERQAEQETQAANWIKAFLEKNDIPYDVQEFQTQIPIVNKELLTVDGKEIPCKATSFVSGTITNNHTLISSLIGTQPLIDLPNINFNPLCSSISRGNHYFAPSVAIARSDVQTVIDGTEICAEIEVTKTEHTSQNILVGNTKNPTNIFVCHYDSIGPGATDNASGTAMLLALAICNPEALKDTLFLIGGNEEVSYDYPLYWGRGYRAFEKEYATIIESAKSIYVVDCVGDAPVTFDNSIETVRLCFPIAGLESAVSKTSAVYGSFTSLMTVYQSDIDTPDVLNKQYLEETYQALQRKLF